MWYSGDLENAGAGRAQEVVVIFYYEWELDPGVKSARGNRNESLPKSNLGLVKMTTVENNRLLTVLNGITLLGGLYLCRMS